MSALFRDAAQRARCGMVLLGPMGEKRARYWDEGGPTMGARTAAAGSPFSLYGLSITEVLLIRIALDVWNGSGRVSLGEVLELLDLPNTRLVCSFVIATNGGGEAIDEWLARHEIKQSVKKAVKKARATNVVPIRRSKA